MITPRDTTVVAAPLTYFSAHALAFVLVGALLATWPAFVFGGPFLFSDTVMYVQHGDSAFRMLTNMLPTSGAGIGDAAGAAEVSDSLFFRSPQYALFLHVASLGNRSFTTLAMIQNALIMIAVWPLVAQRWQSAPLALLAAASAVVLLLSSLPFFGAYVMPDGLAGIIIVYYLVLVTTFERMTWPSRTVLLLVAALAVSAHYGNMPLAFAIAGVALLVQLVRRRLTLGMAVFAVLPLVLTLATNAGVAVKTTGEASAAPKRLPVLLARSMQDGPARWHLETSCDVYGYAVCDVFGDDMPDTVRDMLFRQEEAMRYQPAEMLERIRDEEFIILARAFLEYPLEQTWALGGNALRQLVRVGLDEHYGGAVVTEGELTTVLDFGAHDEARRVLGAIHQATYLLALLILAVGWPRRPSLVAEHAAVLAVLAAGIAANALVFGGLSYPTDRYGGRIAWVPVTVASLAVMNLLRAPTPHKQRTRGSLSVTGRRDADPSERSDEPA